MSSCKGRIQINGVGGKVAEVNIETWKGKRGSIREHWKY